MTTTSATCSKVQPVTAKILVLAVDFGGTDTFTYYGRSGSGCSLSTVTTSGPLKGEIPHPGPRDNNTVWYDPAETANATFYENLIFGYQGVGRVRLDLNDPVDHQPGINLAGYTVQDYFDHMAGVGNVLLEGSVEGWVTVDHSEGYYGAQGCSAASMMEPVPLPAANWWSMPSKSSWRSIPTTTPTPALRLSGSSSMPISDGVVDSLWIIHAGMGQEAGGGPQGDFAIWSHSSDLRKSSQWQTGLQVYGGRRHEHRRRSLHHAARKR